MDSIYQCNNETKKKNIKYYLLGRLADLDSSSEEYSLE